MDPIMRKRTDLNSSLAFVHTRASANAMPKGTRCEFRRLPLVGEFIMLSSKKGADHWYRVALVVHTPWKQSDFDAEIHAVQVDHHKVKHDAITPPRRIGVVK